MMQEHNIIQRMHIETYENKVMDMINYYGKDPQRSKQIYDASMDVIKEGSINAFHL